MTDRTDLEKAQGVLDQFKIDKAAGHPWLPGATFISNPGLDLYILAALEQWVHTTRVAEQSKPARRVSLTEVPDGQNAGEGPAQ